MAEQQNTILNYLSRRLGVHDPNAVWLLTLLSVLPVDRFPLEDWNEALSHVAGRKIWCPSYKILISYLQRLALDVE